METSGPAQFSPIRLAGKIIVFAYGYLLLFLFHNHQIHRYLGERFYFVAVIGGIVLIALSVGYSAGRPAHARASGTYAWLGLLLLAAPVTLAFASQPGVLGSKEAHHHHASFGPPGHYQPNSLKGGGPGAVKTMVSDPETGKTTRRMFTKINVMELGTILQESGGTYVGDRVAVRGFVILDSKLGKNRFNLSRFLITCCVVHAAPLRLVVYSPAVKKLETDSWVTVYGMVQKRKPLNDEDFPYEIKAQKIEIIPAPDDAYIDRWKTERPFVF